MDSIGIQPLGVVQGTPQASSSGRPSSEAASLPTYRERFLRACRSKPNVYPPVWLMRQAGRVLPEYRALKEKYTFLQLVQTPDLATEVTVQPVRRFGFDAAIFFSDILVIPEAMGQAYNFLEGGGIEMSFAIQSAADVDRLQVEGVRSRLDYVPTAQRLCRTALGPDRALIGFAGSPWTLANFMLEGGSAREATRARVMLNTEPAVFERLMEKLTVAVAEYLRMQVEAGVDAVQIFDSLGGLLPAHQYEAASGRWIREIIRRLDGSVPVIVFGKGANDAWASLVATGADILSVDWVMDLAEVRKRLPQQVGVQGNLDPAVLQTRPDAVRREVNGLLERMRGLPGHIFNLGHGVPPSASLENLETLVQTIREFH